MARFDWPRFLRQHKIEYVTSGPNTARGNLSIRCPWCGENDPSHHLGVSLKGPAWGCLRNSAHRGRSPARLIRKLLGCSEEEARRVLGVNQDLAPAHDDFAASVAALKASAGLSEKPLGPLKLPSEFKPLLNGSVFAIPFLDYLRERGYRGTQIGWLAENYRLHYATKGSFAYRLIIPIYDRYGELLSWTARTISPDTQPRYKTLRVTAGEPNAPVARLAANNTILGLPVLWGADNPRALILVEGPFDALKVTAFGHTLGVYATALFGLNVYPAQVGEVLELARRFDRVFLLIDEDAELQRLRLLNQLSTVDCYPLKTPVGTDDPGAMTGSEVVDLCFNLNLG